MIPSSLLLVAFAAAPAPIEVPIQWPTAITCPKAFAWFPTARVADASFISEKTHVDVVTERVLLEQPTDFNRLRFTPSLVGFSVQVQCVSDNTTSVRIDCIGKSCQQTVLLSLTRSISPLSTMHGDGVELLAHAQGKPELSLDQQVQLRNAVAAALGSARDSLEVACRAARCRKAVQTLDDDLNSALVRKGRWKLAAVRAPESGHRARAELELGDGAAATLECVAQLKLAHEMGCMLTGTFHGTALRWTVDPNDASETLTLPPGKLHLANNGALEVEPSLLVMH